MQYHSTRGGSGQLDSAAAVLQGLAQDGGLFLPVEIPAFDWGTCLTCDTKKWQKRSCLPFCRIYPKWMFWWTKPTPASLKPRS